VTVGELKAALEGVSDDTPVVVFDWDGEGGTFANWAEELRAAKPSWLSGNLEVEPDEEDYEWAYPPEETIQVLLIS